MLNISYIMPKDTPYYLDFNLSPNTHQDKLGRRFQNYECIQNNQEQINTNIQNKIFDYTQKYQNCVRQNNPTKYLKVKTENQEPIQSTVSNHTKTNPLGFWGINDSNRNSVRSMSPEYLQMKHQQELTQLQQNSHNYSGLIDQVKLKQAKEIQMKLEADPNCQVEPFVNDKLTGDKMYAGLNSFGSKTTCLNAQGEWQDYNSSNYVHNKPNKYEALKKMSPETLNKIYSKPGNQDILPAVQDQGDVFDLTSLKYRIQAPSHHQKLKEIEKSSRQIILLDRNKLQSFNQDRIYNDSKIAYCPL